MKKNDIKTIELNNGVKMPQVGLGTFLVPEKEISRLIGKAYALGYRNFDTAWRYHNEKAIAAALKENGIRREDVFITTKVNADALYFWGFHAKKTFLNIRRRTIRGAIEDSFRNLGGAMSTCFWFTDFAHIMEKCMRRFLRFIGKGGFAQSVCAQACRDTLST